MSVRVGGEAPVAESAFCSCCAKVAATKSNVQSDSLETRAITDSLQTVTRSYVGHVTGFRAPTRKSSCCDQQKSAVRKCLPRPAASLHAESTREALVQK